MDPLGALHNKVNELPQALWRLRAWEVSPEQLGDRELAIRTKSQELADRNNEVEGELGIISEVLGVVKPHNASKDFKYSTVDIELPSDPKSGKRLSATFGKSPNGSARIHYYTVDADQTRTEVPRSRRYHTSIFDVEDTTALTLELMCGTFTWMNDHADYDSSRVEILDVADSVVTEWEGITSMLLQAMRDPVLNPEYAERLAQIDTKEVERMARVAAFIGGTGAV